MLTIVVFGQADCGLGPSATAQEPAATGGDLGVIMGQVTSADSGGRLSKSTVSLYAADAGRSQRPVTARTDENGEYRFHEVKPGKYRLSAYRNGYLRQAYGQKTTDKGSSLGTLLTVRPGEMLRGIDFQISRGGVIEGQIVDQDYEPMSRVNVALSRPAMVLGQRTLVPVDSSQSDDRGIYRLFDILPGRYYLRATYRRLETPQEGISFAPTFYPGVLAPQEAIRIQVEPGAEVSGVDLTLIEMASYSVRGRVLHKNRSPAASTIVISMEQATNQWAGTRKDNVNTDAQGNFRLMLIPGRYQLAAYSSYRTSTQTASALVEVGEEDVSDVTLVLAEGAEIAGRIAIDGSDEGFDLSHAVVSVTPAEPVFPFFRRRSSEVQEDLTFHITNVPSGAVRFRVSLPPGMATFT